MRLLVVTNLYPPHHIGGYELGCRDVVHALRQRGHKVQVLTSTFCSGADGPIEAGVERMLHFVASAADPPHRKLREIWRFIGALRQHRPELVYFWNQAGLVHWLPLVARGLGVPIAFFLSDTTFVSWRIAAFLARFTRPDSRKVPTQIARALFGGTFLARGRSIVEAQPCHFASHFLRRYAERHGIHPAAATSGVAHWGIEIRNFAREKREEQPISRLLYVGQLIPQKGAHTAVAALARLAGETSGEAMRLTIAGGGLEPAYEQTLRAMPAELGIANRVTFPGRVPRAELPGLYASHDVLIFPSEWDEPFAITPLEAISAGLAVVGTDTGGSGELLRDRETAMIFRAGDAAACAAAIRALAEDGELRQRIRARAAAEVAEHHTLDRMVDTIEDALRRAAKRDDGHCYSEW